MVPGDRAAGLRDIQSPPALHGHSRHEGEGEGGVPTAAPRVVVRLPAKDVLGISFPPNPSQLMVPDLPQAAFENPYLFM